MGIVIVKTHTSHSQQKTPTLWPVIPVHPDLLRVTTKSFHLSVPRFLGRGGVVRESLCYFCEGLGTVAPEVTEVTARTVIIPGGQFCLLGLKPELIWMEELGLGSWK